MPSVRFAPGKIVRSNQSTVTPSMTAWRDMQGLEFQPLGGTVLLAPSSMIIDRFNQVQYYLNKPFSAVNNQLTAMISTQTFLDLL